VGKKLLGVQNLEDVEDGNPIWKQITDVKPKEGKVWDKFLMFICKPWEDALKAKVLLFRSNCLEGEYCYFTDWEIVPIEGTVEITSKFKFIGETIRSIKAHGYRAEDLNKYGLPIQKNDGVQPMKNLDTSQIFANHIHWIASVGEGYWLAKDNAPYTFITIRTLTKVINLGVAYHDCHYPNTIWDVI
jgi:hypothetical protein